MSFKKPLTIIIIFIIVSMTGCSKATQTTTTKPEQPKQIQRVEESKTQTKKYITPFIEFNYPSDFIEDDAVMNAGDDIVIAYTNANKYLNDKSKVIQIMVNKATGGNEMTNADWGINWWLDNWSKDHNMVITCKPKDIGNIKYAEYVTYEKYNYLDKIYVWSDNKGKTYMASISGTENNRDNIEKVAQVFEKSIKFKQ